MAKSSKKPTKPTPSPSMKQRWQARIALPLFGRLFACFGLLVLVLTTFVWAWWGARLQLQNADQLVNAYLFENDAVFKGATFPGAHTFLFKWPLFLAIKLLGNTTTAYMSLTVAVSLVTVLGLVFIVRSIEKRPLMLGVFCLALASMLLLVPARPTAGALLPVNMAMLATRNLEYLLYIGVLVLVVRSRSMRSWQTWLALILLSILGASDKLFLALSAGGGAIMIVAYAAFRRWKLVTLAVNWLLITIGAAILASALLAGINAVHLTHIANGNNASPYDLSSGGRNIVLGALYAVMALFTNFGANPAFDAAEVREIGHTLASRLLSWGGIAFAVNAILLLLGCAMVWRLVQASLKRKTDKLIKLDAGAHLALLLLASTLTMIGLYVATNHYYAVDARYLGISLFAISVCVAVVLRKRVIAPGWLVLSGLVLTLVCLAAMAGSAQMYYDARSATADLGRRNKAISQALAQHPVNVLVGDYWRVIPTKFVSTRKMQVTPLQSCTEPRQALSSTAWQPDLRGTSFGYLLSLDGSPADFPQCSLSTVIQAYGQPNASVVTEGSVKQPKEVLLLYDQGIQTVASEAASPTSITPVPLDQLGLTECNVPTLMTIVAHQDDDLLFTSPDLLKSVQAGHCIRTVYVTAGDAGQGSFYWLSREQGSETAYAKMANIANVWSQRLIRITDDEVVTVASPRDDPKISLIFMHLPDGNLQGTGFSASNYQNLEKLQNGIIDKIHTIYGQSSYTKDQLVTALDTLMHLYQPSEIHTQATYPDQTYPDHSDHIAVGSFTQEAYDKYEAEQYENTIMIPLKKYIGYPIHGMDQNVFDSDLATKTNTFLSYAVHDGGICNPKNCQLPLVYQAYLQRQYTQQ